MKITIKKQIDEEIDIELPAYYEFANCITKVIEPEFHIDVREDGTSIQINNFSVAQCVLREGRNSTKEIFNNAFQKALNKFNGIDLEKPENNTDAGTHIYNHIQ